MSELLVTHAIIIDRPRGSSHPRYPEIIYPLDYGYLENTRAGDGDGMDLWLGSLNSVVNQDGVKMLTGILCTFDTLTEYRRNTLWNPGTQPVIFFSDLEFSGKSGKRDAEIKLLPGCTEADVQTIQGFHQEKMYTLYIPNPEVVIK